MTEARQTPYINEWREEILGEYIERAVSATDPLFDNTARWQLQRVRENDYSRREYGREFKLVWGNMISQTSSLPEFTRETAKALRDMLNEALGDE